MLGFALAVTSLVSVAAATPAIRSITSDTTIAEAWVGTSRAGVRVRRVLAVVQIALAALLLSVGALLIRTLLGLLQADIGVEPRGVIVSQLMLADSMRFDASEKRAWMQNPEIERLHLTEQSLHAVRLARLAEPPPSGCRSPGRSPRCRSPARWARSRAPCVPTSGCSPSPSLSSACRRSYAVSCPRSVRAALRAARV